MTPPKARCVTCLDVIWDHDTHTRQRPMFCSNKECRATYREHPICLRCRETMPGRGIGQRYHEDCRNGCSYCGGWIPLPGRGSRRQTELPPLYCSKKCRDAAWDGQPLPTCPECKKEVAWDPNAKIWRNPPAYHGQCNPGSRSQRRKAMYDRGLDWKFWDEVYFKLYAVDYELKFQLRKMQKDEDERVKLLNERRQNKNLSEVLPIVFDNSVTHLPDPPPPPYLYGSNFPGYLAQDETYIQFDIWEDDRVDQSDMSGTWMPEWQILAYHPDQPLDHVGRYDMTSAGRLDDRYEYGTNLVLPWRYPKENPRYIPAYDKSSPDYNPAARKRAIRNLDVNKRKPDPTKPDVTWPIEEAGKKVNYPYVRNIVPPKL